MAEGDYKMESKVWWQVFETLMRYTVNHRTLPLIASLSGTVLNMRHAPTSRPIKLPAHDSISKYAAAELRETFRAASVSGMVITTLNSPLLQQMLPWRVRIM